MDFNSDFLITGKEECLRVLAALLAVALAERAQVCFPVPMMGSSQMPVIPALGNPITSYDLLRLDKQMLTSFLDVKIIWPKRAF